MIYLFEDFELGTAKVELRTNGVAIPIEPQVFALLRLVVENRDRLVTREELIERIWDGRIISDSAVASRVKSSRGRSSSSGFGTGGSSRFRRRQPRQVGPPCAW
jgi:DNA-binding winged helix-turn-helix (wHTH) protein